MWGVDEDAYWERRREEYERVPEGWKPESEQPFPGAMVIRTDNLKAIRCPEAGQSHELGECAV